MDALDSDQKKTSDTILALYELAKKMKIRTATKLLQAARGKVDGSTMKLAEAALIGNTGKQLFTPAPRSKGKSAAEGPGSVMMADLIDMSKNARSKFSNQYALVLQDVYTRQVDTQPLKDKSASTVNAAMKDMLDTPTNGKSIKLPTDDGKAFSSVDEFVP